MGDIKKNNIKNPTHYFFNDMINIRDLHLSLPKIYSKLLKNFGIYYIGYITTKNYITA